MTEPLAGRRIVLGITGGVAAYKAVELCRELVRRGAHVQPVLTAGAERFIGALTLSAVASEPARTELWGDPVDTSPHTRMGQQADLVLVAPATASFLAAARAGLANDLLGAILLATRAPVVMAPAMHTEMWEHAATRDNVRVLGERGVRIVAPQHGELAGGDIGTGRLADTATIVAACEQALGRHASLEGRTVLISAGGTREPIDPVRFVGNRSSGRQGHAIAEAALDRGATVLLVTTAEPPAELVARGVEVVRVETAEQMRAALVERAPAADIVVMAAAVADHRPVAPADHKLKRREGVPTLQLEPTPVIIDELVARRTPGQVIVGFAAETDHLLAHARQKLDGSGADLVVANDVSQPGVGFEHATNAVSILGVPGADAGGARGVREIPLASKRVIAHAVLDAAIEVRDLAASAVGRGGIEPGVGACGARAVPVSRVEA